MFKRNGINTSDIERMKRNFATEIVNSNIPAALSVSTNAQPLGDNIIYTDIVDNVVTEVDSGYKSLTNILISETFARSNIQAITNPYRDLTDIGEDPTKLSGIILSHCGGFAFTQISASVTVAIAPEDISDVTRTTIYFRLFHLDDENIIQSTMLNSLTIPAEPRTTGTFKNRINLSLNFGAKIEIKDKFIFGIGVEYQAGDTFPESLAVNRFQCNFLSYNRKKCNSKS